MFRLQSKEEPPATARGTEQKAAEPAKPLKAVGSE
jgi:hypothetical protein